LVPNTERWKPVAPNPEQNPIHKLVEESSRERRVEKAVEELYSRLNLLRADYSFIVKLVRDSGLLELADLYENLKNCTEEYTYVYNKASKKYYYYYLKCKSGDRRSIYVGKTPEGYNQFRRAAALAHELKTKLEALLAAVNQLEDTLRQLQESAALVETALTRIKK
jgi:hypothetical protein